MYCRKCYTSLKDEVGTGKCPKCGRRFDAKVTSSFLLRPFPSGWKIFTQIAATTIVGILVAMAVAWFQMATAIAPIPSGH